MSIFLKGDITSYSNTQEGIELAENSSIIWKGKWRFVKEKKEHDFEYNWVSDEIPLDLVQFVSFISPSGAIDARIRSRKKKKRRRSSVKLNGRNVSSHSNNLNNTNSIEPPDANVAVQSPECDCTLTDALRSIDARGEGGNLENGGVDESHADDCDVEAEEDEPDAAGANALSYVKIDRADPSSLFGLWRGHFNVEMAGSTAATPVEETFFLYGFAGTPFSALPDALSILPPEQMYSLPLLLNLKPKELRGRLSSQTLSSDAGFYLPPYGSDHMSSNMSSSLNLESEQDAEITLTDGVVDDPMMFSAGLASSHASSINLADLNGASIAPSSSSVYDNEAMAAATVLLGFGRNMYGRYSMSCFVDKDARVLRCEKRYMLSKQGNSRKFKPKVYEHGEGSLAPADGEYDDRTKRKRTPKPKFMGAPEEDGLVAEGAEDARWTRPGKPLVYAMHEQHFREAFFDEASGEIYEGDFFGYLRHGRGLCLYPDGTMYEGTWERGLEHGKGKLMRGEGRELIYAGTWFEGQISGTGVYYYSNGDKYTGEFKDGARSGFGEYLTSDGHRYLGDWVANVRHGRGSFSWSGGSSYEGEWEGNARHGKGALSIVGGIAYDGTWVRNHFDGKGVATYAGGQVFQGSYRQGLREGRGSISFVEGAMYEGRFRDDRIDGQGTLQMSAIAPGVAPGEVMIPVQIQADLRRVHFRAGFGDDAHGH